MKIKKLIIKDILHFTLYLISNKFTYYLIQLLQAKGADKMLWMKFSEHSRDATTCKFY